VGSAGGAGAGGLGASADSVVDQRWLAPPWHAQMTSGAPGAVLAP
jgi:hypothetical protein